MSAIRKAIGMVDDLVMKYDDGKHTEFVNGLRCARNQMMLCEADEPERGGQSEWEPYEWTHTGRCTFYGYRCRNCGKENVRKDKFCRECGKRMVNHDDR